MCLEVAEKLEKESGADIEVVDLRSLLPLDIDAIRATVKKTGKVLVVHEDKVFGGFGGEIAAIVADKAFEYLDGPVRRLGSAFTPVGFNRILEKAILPDTDKIIQTTKELLDY
jgi:2-oxoisovalerate dehydrogenase E1 component